MAMDFPHHPRLFADGEGRLAGGYQLASGEDGYYEIFSASEGAVRHLGRFNGRLAGVAMDGDGDAMALTRDGALEVYGDDPESLAFPGASWNMAALTWWNGAPLALTLAEDGMRTARPGSDGEWAMDETAPVPGVDQVSRAEFVAFDGKLHLFWNHRAEDFSGGAIRHALLHDGKWEELPPLPLGDVESFSAFPDDNELVLVALVPDPVGAGEDSATAFAWKNGEWLRHDLPDPVEKRLSDAHGFAAAVSGSDSTAWLTTGPHGATLASISSKGIVFSSGVAPTPELPSLWSQWMRLFSLAGIILLTALYCRRSRKLSRLFPAQPPDLLSRAAALAVDWLLVSFGMGAYHLASGDVFILPELMAMGDIMELFWVNLIALSLFMAITEAAYGRTPGKYLAALRVRHARGGPAGVTQTLIRNVMRAVDMFPVPIAFPGIIGAVATFFNPGRQRIGDIVAGTVVRRHLPLRERKFLLASASPRRLELMQALGVNVRTQAADINEGAIAGETPEETVLLLSQAKAKAAAASPADREVVIAADTIVVLDGEILGKPKDAADAAGMLSRLSGRSHSVFTGVTVWDAATGQGVSDVEQTEVEFRQLSQREIDDYVATGDPMDKAGAYGVQTGYLVKQIRGSLSNVAGLPMEKLQGMLLALDS